MSDRAPATPSQTVGPFFAFALPWPHGADLASAQTVGERIAIEGRVLDGAGAGVGDALVEVWQANAAGRYAHPADVRTDVALDPAFLGFGRCPTDAQGRFAFTTVRPGAVPGPDGRPQARHLAVSVLARGLLRRLMTRIYFADDTAVAHDAILALVPAERRATLIARREPADSLDARYRFDIVLQGPGETVFFAC